MRYVYFVEAIGTGMIKIGQSDDVAYRLQALRTTCPHELRELGMIPATFSTETEIHEALNQHRIRGEWFRHSSIVQRVVEMLLSGDAIRSRAAIRWIKTKHQAAVQAKIEAGKKVRRKVHPWGAGRKELPPGEARDNTLRIRLKPEERRLVDEAAQANGHQNTSAWAREKLLQLAGETSVVS